MKDIQFSYAKAVSAEAVQAYTQQVAIAQEQLVNGTGLGNDFLARWPMWNLHAILVRRSMKLRSKSLKKRKSMRHIGIP